MKRLISAINIVERKVPNSNQTHLTEEQLLLLVESWHKQYYRRLFDLGYKMVADKVLVKDSIQDVFLELWRKKHLIAEIKMPWPYLKRMYSRRLLQNKSRLPHLTELDQVNQENTSPSYETRLIAMQEKSHQKDTLRNFLQDLPPTQKRMLEMKYAEGYTYDEIAGITGKSKQTIYNQVFRAVGKLKNLLKGVAKH